MNWEAFKCWIFMVKRLEVTVVTHTGKSIEKFTAKSMTQGAKNRIFRLENGLKIKVSNGLACVVKEVWTLDGKVLED